MPVLVWSTVHHYVTVENPGGIQLLLMSSQKVNDEVLKNVGTPHLSCMPHAEVVSVCTGRLKNRRGRDGRSGGLGGGALNRAAAKCQTLIVGKRLLNVGEQLWRNPSFLLSFTACIKN